MTSLPRSSRWIGRQRLPRSAAGMISLVELMIVVLVISMLFLAAVPAYQRVQLNARATAVANDLRVFGATFQSYAHESGSWPPESPPGVLPDGISAKDIQVDVWAHRTPMGGKFDWEYNQAHPGATGPGGKWRAAVAITATAEDPLILSEDILLKVDEILDDGNLETGNFRTGFGYCPLLILER